MSKAQEPPPEPPAAGAPRPSPTPPTQDPQPYDKVITKDAKSKQGVFTVHQVKDKYYYEIPKNEFNKEFLWVTQIARTTLGVGYGGQALVNRVVRWERNGNKMHLRNIELQCRRRSQDADRAGGAGGQQRLDPDDLPGGRVGTAMTRR